MDGRLALFPLPVVLFPGARLPLHVFEARYRRMVARCLEFDRRFGIVYHDPDRMGPFLLEAGRVGCVALIEDFRPLPEGGRSLILTRGQERFGIRDGIESGEPFYEAVVEPFTDGAATPGSELRAQRSRSLRLFRAALDAAGEGAGVGPDLDVEEELSFRLAASVVIDPAWQQSLLELRSEVRRLHRLDAVFRAAARKLGSG